MLRAGVGAAREQPKVLLGAEPLRGYGACMKLLGGLVLALVLITGCGGGDTASQPSAAEKASAAASASASKSAEEAAEAREQAAAERKVRQSALYKECQAVTSDLSKKLGEINSLLSVGLSFERYSDKVGAAKVSYDAVLKDLEERGGVSGRCLNKVALPLESSMNGYLSAYQVWQGCIDDPGCSFDEGSSALTRVQGKWEKAGIKVTRADTALSNMQPTA